MDSARKHKADLILAIGMGKPHGMHGSAKPDEEGGDDDAALEDAMSSLLDAWEAKDPKAMAAAFRTAHEVCASYEDKGEESEEPEEGE